MSSMNARMSDHGNGGCASRVGDEVGSDGKGDAGFDFSDISLSDLELDFQPVRKRETGQKLVVVHSYHDHLNDPILSHPQSEKGQAQHQDTGTASDLVPPSPAELSTGDAPCETLIFPEKLHYMLHQLEQEGLQHIASWMPHGRSFVVSDKQEFLKSIVPRYDIEMLSQY
jgi:HSF-type DNA-binding